MLSAKGNLFTCKRRKKSASDTLPVGQQGDKKGKQCLVALSMHLETAPAEPR